MSFKFKYKHELDLNRDINYTHTCRSGIKCIFAGSVKMNLLLADDVLTGYITLQTQTHFNKN